MTKCVCPVAGFCETHQKDMSAFDGHKWKQCQNSDDYFDAMQATRRKVAPVNLPIIISQPCTKRGSWLDTLACCGEVYQCKDKYRRCTIGSNSSQIQACSNCNDHSYFTVQANVDPLVSHGYCINLNYRMNRWDRFVANVQSLKQWPFTVTRFSATDGFDGLQPEWWRAGAGAWGCRQSHLRALQDAWDKGYESIVIFEDDAEFTETFYEDAKAAIAELPADWKLLFLGGQHNYTPGNPEPFSSLLIKAKNVGRTHAMMWSREGIRWALDFWGNLKDWEPQPTWHIDHILGWAISVGKITAYACQPWLVSQTAGWSDIAKQEFGLRHWWHGDEPYRVKIAPTGEWVEDNGESGRYHDRLLEGRIISLLKGARVESVWDMGCGRDAMYTLAMCRVSINATGIDGCPDTNPQIAQVANLAHPIKLQPRECVVSLEVGEHIPAEYEDNFLDNLTNHAQRLIILSWAIPGQGGRGHVNCRSNDYIVERMSERGWQHDAKASQNLRRVVLQPWFRNTIMVFRKNSLELGLTRAESLATMGEPT